MRPTTTQLPFGAELGIANYVAALMRFAPPNRGRVSTYSNSPVYPYSRCILPT